MQKGSFKGNLICSNSVLKFCHVEITYLYNEYSIMQCVVIEQKLAKLLAITQSSAFYIFPILIIKTPN